MGRAQCPVQPSPGSRGSVPFQPKMLQSEGNLRVLFSECGEVIPASFTCSHHLRQRCHFRLFHLLFLSMLLGCVVTCLLHRTLVFFHNITGQLPKNFTFQVTKRSSGFYMFSSCSFLFLICCDVCIWQLIPKTCFVLFISCMDLKRARKYHH